METAQRQRVQRLLYHVSPRSCASEDISKIPLPPVATLPEDMLFPTFPTMKEAEKIHGKVVSWEIIGGRRITIVNDPKVMELVFEPGEYGNPEIKVEMDKLAYAWFGIPKEIASYTRAGLDAVRKTLNPQAVANVGSFNDKVATGILADFSKLGGAGEAEVYDVARATFWGVTQAMFGESTIAESICPEALEWFHTFDADLPKMTMGLPKSMFEESEAAAKKITNIFTQSIEAGHHEGNPAACPVLANRLAVCAGDPNISNEAKGRFMLSIFWASQANTLPITFWLLAHCLADPRVKAKVEQEVRAGPFKDQGADGHYDVETLPYLCACLNEVLRLRICNLTHRKVDRDVAVTTSTGQRLRIPKGDMLSVASYLQHYEPSIYENPFEFRPERWLDGTKYPEHHFFPFGKGRYSCSGRHLALLEIPTLVAIFMRDFDTELVGLLPEPDWDEVLAVVRPEGWPNETNCRVQYTCRAT